MMSYTYLAGRPLPNATHYERAAVRRELRDRMLSTTDFNWVEESNVWAAGCIACFRVGYLPSAGSRYGAILTYRLANLHLAERINIINRAL